MTEPLAPLTDARVRELSNLARCGPDVVAMAQEVARSRERIAELEAENARLFQDGDCAREYVREALRVSMERSAALREIAIAIGLPADAAPDAVLAAAAERSQLSAVERRWSEVCAHIEACITGSVSYPEFTLRSMLGELNALYVVTQYAGSNARTGWLMLMDSYREQIGAADDPR